MFNYIIYIYIASVHSTRFLLIYFSAEFAPRIFFRLSRKHKRETQAKHRVSNGLCEKLSLETMASIEWECQEHMLGAYQQQLKEFVCMEANINGI